VRENNKNKHGIDKNSNHRVTQKVWRLEKDRVPQQKQQYQEKDNNMHSVTSRRQERQGPSDDDITKVKTLQDATLKASRLYGMMRDFINNNIPAKINYQKIHSKWRNVKKQVQVGGEDKIMFVSPKVGPAGPVDDDKDCVELPPKLSLHVTAHPDDPKKFILTRTDGDKVVNGSLTKFAERLIGHLDKMKAGTEFDIGDSDILARIAHDLILFILTILSDYVVIDDDDDDDDDGEKRRRLLAEAINAESRNAAAAAIIIALIGLIKNAPPPPPPPLTPDWKALKDLWLEVDTKCKTIAAYTKELNENAVSTGPLRQDIYDWLKMNDSKNYHFDSTSYSQNTVLYNALSYWIAKWNEYGGKIRVIVSIKGGGRGSGTNNPIIIKDEEDGFNTTKTLFEPDYKVTASDRASYGLDDNEYGKFYAGFDASLSNSDRYNRGNFKDLITTLLNGGNAAIFGYGYSGSGKTYTLTNYDPNPTKTNERGIAIQLLGELLTNISISIKLSISELYCKDFTITPRKEVEFAENITPLSLKSDIDIVRIDDFINAIVSVKNERIRNERIKYTLNNPESSRGHLFYKFTINDKTSGNNSVLTIVDMGGRENPVELSESSYMTVSKVDNDAPIGQIVERVDDDTAVYFAKLHDEYPPEPNKIIETPNLCNVIRHVTGERTDSWNPKCNSIIAGSFGELFFNNYKHAFNSYEYDRLPLTPLTKNLDPDIKVILNTKIRLFLDACKEGLYINETINHLVAYINFLSNIPTIVNIPKKIAKTSGTNYNTGGLISLKKTKTSSTTVYTYNPKRYIKNPLEYIKSKAPKKLNTLLNDTAVFNSISAISSGDTIGILKELWEIKNPNEKVPAIICFIACVRDDNTLPKDKQATKSTLEFAMSVSASNASPPVELDHVDSDVEDDSHSDTSEDPLYTAKELKGIIDRISDPRRVKQETALKDHITDFKKRLSSKKKGTSEEFVNFLIKQFTSKILETDKKRIGTPDDIFKKIIEPVMVRYLRYIILNKHLLTEIVIDLIDNPDNYTTSKNKGMIKAAAKVGGGGSGAKTRKRGGLGKKNRITRRRNRV
jgi:hypothetical protein